MSIDILGDFKSISIMRPLISSDVKGLPVTDSFSRLRKSTIYLKTLFSLLFLISSSFSFFRYFRFAGSVESWLSFTNKCVRLIRSRTTSGNCVSLLWFKFSVVSFTRFLALLGNHTSPLQKTLCSPPPSVLPQSLKSSFPDLIKPCHLQ